MMEEEEEDDDDDDDDDEGHGDDAKETASNSTNHPHSILKNPSADEGLKRSGAKLPLKACHKDNTSLLRSASMTTGGTIT